MFDYYRLLQVDIFADSEIIEMAYKKLAKKYHPDVCKEQQGLDMMRKINEAYEVLSTPKRRSEYDQKMRINRLNNEYVYPRHDLKSSKEVGDRLNSARNLLLQYFEAIMKKEYSKAYQRIYPKQRELMSLSAFKNWQHWTSRVYDLIEVNLTNNGYQENVIFNGICVDYLITFEVEVLEYNQIMEHYESGRFIKRVMVINQVHSVYLDQIEVSEIIKRYEKLAKLKIGKWRAGKLRLANKTRRLDSFFFNQLDMEVERFTRYSIPFSLVFLKIANTDPVNFPIITNQLSEIINQHIRKLDIYMVIDKHTFVILLPSTKLNESTTVAEKICEIATMKASLNPLSFTVRRIIIENEYQVLDELIEMVQLVLSELNQEEVTS